MSGAIVSDARLMFIDHLRFVIKSLKSWFDLKQEIKLIDKADPVLHRLNEMLVCFIAEKLVTVPPERFKEGLKVGLRIDAAFFIFSLFSPKKWFYVFLLLIFSALLFKDLLIARAGLVISLIWIAVFGKKVVYDLVGMGFKASDYFAGGALINAVLRMRIRKPIIVGGILWSYGPIFPLLSVYVGFLSRDERTEYDGINEVYWRYLNSHEPKEFSAMEQRFWSKRAAL